MSSVESYKHKAAKAVFAGWLREAAKDVGIGGDANFLDIKWTVDRQGPNWGVWEEYPIVDAILNTQIPWDNMDPRLPREWNSGRPSPWVNSPPTYEYLASVGMHPKVILDVAVHHIGRWPVLWGVEIIHKNGISDKKRAILNAMPNMVVIGVDADWVLRQVSKPRTLQYQEIIVSENVRADAA